MSKIRRGGHSAEGETLSAGRVEYLEAARARVRTRRIRRTVIIVAVLTILVLFATGAVGSSIARDKRPCGYCRHRAGTSRRLAAADRHHRPGCGGADVWQLCGDGRRQLRGI